MVAVVWNFEIVPDQSEAFETFYGADGDWTKLSRRSRSFLGSSFLKNLAHPEHYVLVGTGARCSSTKAPGGFRR